MKNTDKNNEDSNNSSANDGQFHPVKLSRGPKGLGDPSDRTLRKVETEVMIPKIIRERSKQLKCSEFKKAFDDCCLENALAHVYKCREENRQYQQCLNYWFNDKSFIEECKEIYLQQRSEFRRTGIKRMNNQRKSNTQISTESISSSSSSSDTATNSN